MSKKITLRLTVDVTYDLQGAGASDMEQNLYMMVEDAMGNGLITGDGPAEVKTWHANVQTVWSSQIGDGKGDVSGE